MECIAAIEESDEETLAGVTLDTEPIFKTHVQPLCPKAKKKLHALSCISKVMEPEEINLMINTFVMSQFKHCPLILMFHDRNIDNKINRIQEMSLEFHTKIALFIVRS